MKYLFTTLFIALIYSNCFGQVNSKIISHSKLDSIDKANTNTVRLSGKYIQKATVSKIDSSIYLVVSMRPTRIFGYQRPDINSKKEILISIFTNDVEGNPFQCALGAYYQTISMDNMEMKFTSNVGSFIKVKVTKNHSMDETIYILKKWIEFEK